MRARRRGRPRVMPVPPGEWLARGFATHFGDTLLTGCMPQALANYARSRSSWLTAKLVVKRSRAAPTEMARATAHTQPLVVCKCAHAQVFCLARNFAFNCIVAAF